MFQRRRHKARRNGNNTSPGKKGQYYDNDNYNSRGGGIGGGALANFDACVEACDAMAASSGKMSVEYTGKSIMISPDGELLSCNSMPSIIDGGVTGRRGSNGGSGDSGDDEEDKEDKASSSTSTSTSTNDDEFTKSTDTIQDEHQRENNSSTTNTDQNDDTTTTTTTDNSNLQNNVTGERNAGISTTQSVSSSSRDDEFESSIFIGNDVQPDGEKVLNGFSARGWNPIMATLAIRRAVDTLQTTGKFVEELILTRKNSAANASQACEQLRDMMVFEGEENDDSNNSHKKNNESDNDPPTSLGMDDDRSNSGQRSSAGPLLFPGSSLYEGLLAMEKYNSNIAEGDAHRWRMASNSIVTTGTSLDGGVLPSIQVGTRNNFARAERRERALMDSQQHLAEAESILRARKEESRKFWAKVNKAEDEVNRKVEAKMRQRSRDREMKRRHQENERQAALSDGNKLQSTVTQQEIWELVAQVGADNDGSFAPHDLPPPNVDGPIDQTLSTSKSEGSPEKTSEMRTAHPLSPIDDYRAELEEEYRLHELRVTAVESDENVSDAAGKLLNAISAADTTKRSTRIAAETCLLSCANSQMKCLKSLVALERSSLNERLRMINELEEKINKVDVRSDLNLFIEHEKSEIPNGKTSMGDNDDGGIASALATLNSFSEGIGVGVGVAGMAELSSFSGWNEDQEEEVFDRDDLEDAVGVLFDGEAYTEDDTDTNTIEKNHNELEKSITFLEKAVSEKSIRGRGYRASTCYALNNHRGKNTHLRSEKQFHGLCRVLNSLLDGSDREAADVANAKMCMMLAQTFYFVGHNDDGKDRTKRMYPKEKLCHHPIWLDEDFWTQALFQCVTDSLTNSGVMIRVRMKKSERNRKMKWHDLNYQDRADAASQIHAVIFSQLGALAHSMVEFGCSVEQACAFVRRLSVRHQLPLTQRSMLLSHLMNDSANSKESSADNDAT